MIEAGEPAPDFTLPGIENGERRDFTLSEYHGNNVVLAFYPGDNTPGCTRQLCSYRDDWSEFERLGAPLWAGQARTELARIGGRTPTGDELTEAERRIAALVAEGRKNREVAAELFLTVHSVETALTRV